MSRRAGGDPEPIVVSLSWAAAELAISTTTARKLARAGELPGAFPLGNGWRVSTVVFRREIERRAAAAAPGPDRPAAGRPVGPVPLAAAGRTSAQRGAPRRLEGLTGRQIAAEAPRVSITGDGPSLVRRPRNPQGERS